MVPAWLAVPLALASPDVRVGRCRGGSADACVAVGDAARAAGAERRSHRFYRRACAPGHVASCGRLLELYDEGEEVVRAASGACDRGDPEACAELGRWYLTTAPKDHLDHEAAERLLRRACDLGHGPSCASAAATLERRDPGPATAAAATALLEQGCAKDDAGSCHQLAARLFDGRGVERSRDRALEAMTRACALDRAASCDTLGRWLDEGRGGAPPDAPAAAKAWARACELGDGSACASAAARALEADGPTDALAASLLAGCRRGEDEACRGLLALVEAGRATLVPAALLELRRRPAWQAEACAGGHAPSCEAAAARAEDPTVARQLFHEGRRLAAALPDPAAPEGPAPRLPDEDLVRACVVRQVQTLAGLGGREPFTPEGRLAEDHVERALAAAGLATFRLPVVLPADALDSFVVVDGVRHPATPVERSAPGVFDGPVEVTDAPTPPRPSSVAVLVPDRGAPLALDGAVRIPVLRVDPEVAEAAAARGAAQGASVPAGARAVASDVVGVLPGAGALADETVVVGAHLDHFGGDVAGVVWPGADDNASGTAAVLCVAEALARELPGPDRRTVVVVGFTGEELGLFGSRAYVFDPPRPLDRTVAMVNLDMVGRMRDHEVFLRAYPASLAARAAGPLAAVGARARPDEDGIGTSDHLVFAAAGVPAVHLFTGLHGDHHEPTDVAATLNADGLADVARAATALVADLATTPSPPPRAVDTCGEWLQPELGLGLGWGAFRGSDGGLEVRCVAPGSAAEELGLRPGDVVLLGWNELARGWPLEPLSLPVRRGDACSRLALGHAPEAVRCETVAPR